MKIGEINNNYINSYNIRKNCRCKLAVQNINFMSVPAKISESGKITASAINSIIEIYKKEHLTANNIYEQVTNKYLLLKQIFKYSVFFNKLGKCKNDLSTVLKKPIVEPYHDEHAELSNIFISRIESDDSLNVQPCIMLCGDRETYMKLYRYLLRKVSSKVNVINITPGKNGNNIIDTVLNHLKDAVKNYNETGKRTLLIFHDVENILAVPEKSANILGIKTDKNDKKILKKAGYSMSRVSFFKSLLDNVSHLPKENYDAYDTASATTFLFTTENPHLIHPDLTSRKGKLYTIFTSIPEGNTIKNLILEKLNTRKKIKHDAFSETEWNKILTYLNPNSSTGGLSFKRIEQIISEYQNSADYKNRTFAQNQIAVIKALLNTSRDISPDTCKRIKHIKNNLI